jgi:hypothetical protein
VDPAAKITDPDLRVFAENADQRGIRSVIVELKAMPFEVVRRPHTRRGDPLRYAIELSAPQLGDEKDQMDQLEQELSQLGIDDPTRLNTASAFVVNVSPRQLRAVSTLPLVGVIRPNRTHHAPLF